MVLFLLIIGAAYAACEFLSIKTCKGRLLTASLEVWLLYHLDSEEKSGIIDFLRADIDIMNKLLTAF